MMAEFKLLLGACGAANVINLPGYLMALRKLPGIRVHTVLTPAAARLLPLRTVRLVSDAAFDDEEGAFDPGHVALAAWADRILVLPATANTLAHAAHGLAGNLLTTTLLAHPGSVIYVPSMNARMWANPAVRRNVAQLRADGHHVAEPAMVPSWELASGTVRPGPGLPSPERIAALIGDIMRMRETGSQTDPEADAETDPNTDSQTAAVDIGSQTALNTDSEPGRISESVS